ncbi:DUF654-domain-containing protein [Lepidopterella palustris CBS 459.81]|uniref:DUF654-domain-containing protein n=1 Tax=Lepidopterella palustris CBS 459.81 TaxID=1314670 RepID=A0A8E2J9U2_9PEZI|nr:DUF654-domain-containing protein [Lepidopterella palustris CBS 459.81]
MSSRALRRAQRELEDRQQLEKASQQEAEEESDDEVIAAPRSKASIFTMLDAQDAEDDEEEQGDATENVSAHPDEEQKGETALQQHQMPKSSKRKKKKKKKGGKSAAPEQLAKKSSTTMPQLDEIDRALLSLSLNTSQPKGGGKSDELTETVSVELAELFTILSIDTQYLHASNEMRQLFGRAALEGGNEAEPAGGRRRGRGGAQQVGLAGAVAGRNIPGGRNLASLGLRRNIFIQGKEEWPRATSGGLGMEVVEKRRDGTVEYRFVHNKSYQDIQRQFETCVASMDPNRMIQLLQFNPYHISTLLQVSEIAKQERDHATSGDLLERALFSFGRSVHSTFAHNISQGKARLSFRRAENREFWLASWRYINNLGMRSTWRTAFEWGKLVLSLDPNEDPYCIRLVIDQLALRGRQPKQLVDIATSDHLQDLWKIPPNIVMSVSLAYSQLSRPDMARAKLGFAIQEYPWLAARLCLELDISPIPKPIWGRKPLTEYQNVLCELYVTKAKDLWNTPEATSLLVEVASSCGDLIANPIPSSLVVFDEVKLARHVILTDTPALISLLDRRLTARYTSTSDPLPPDDSLWSYSTTSSETPAHRNLENPADIRREYATLQNFFRNLVPWLFEGQGAINPDTGAPPTTEDVERRIRESGVSPNTIAQRTARLEQLRQALREFEFNIDNPDDDGDGELLRAHGDGDDSDEHEDT